ncbi:RecF/RecN/SMC [Haematococcus lacustris]
MHIKQIELSGFKSYKDAAPSEPFSPRINVVVGANGSGKSNFFHAIRFVLNDAFVNMRADERQQLLHEGAGAAVPQAYVEIVFDNSDGRFPVDREEVRLRRTIGRNKDEYHLDRKHINKSEVTNLLESAGFSRSNPYYIVQQGKIMSMSAMKDNDRLELLKEIGGTKVYEERRKESLKLMADTESRRAQIDEVMSVITSKLSELDADRKELAEYQAADRDRRALEFALLERDLSSNRKKLEEVEAEGRRIRDTSTDREGADPEGAADLRAAEEAAAAAAATAKETNRTRTAAKARLQELQSRKAVLEADIGDLEEKVARQTDTAESTAEEVEALQQAITKTEGELEEAREVLAEAEAAHLQQQASLATLEARQLELLRKQGGAKQYSSVGDRDRSLQKEIDNLTAMLATEEARQTASQAQLAALQQAVDQLTQAVEGSEAGIAAATERFTKAEQALLAVRERRDAATNGRKEAWRAEQQASEQYNALNDELNRRQQAFESTMARDISRGVVGLVRLVNDHAVPGVHGRLIDLIQVPSQLNLAVEVTAGNSLFHVVVESDDVALRCSELLRRHKAGRVTFMPLNTLNPMHVQYPTDFGQDVVPLARKIRHDPKFEKAVLQVFSRTVLCRNLEVAVAAARGGELNCVTLEGDQVSKRGAMTGGFHDLRSSRLEAQRLVKEAVQQLDAVRATRESAAAAANQLDAQIAVLNGDVARADGERSAARQALSDVKHQAHRAEREHSTVVDQVTELQRCMAAREASMAAAQTKVEGLHSTLGQPLTTTLGSQELKELKAAPQAIQVAKQAALDSGKAATEARGKVEALLSRLEDRLRPRLKELGEEVDTADLSSLRLQLASHTTELATLVIQLRDAEAAAAAAVTAAEAAAVAAREAQAAQEAAADAEVRRAATVAEAAKSLEALASKRAQLGQRQEDLSARLRALGTLPAEAFERHKGKGSKELQRLLAEANKKLSQFGGVNRKALDQYAAFQEQGEELGRRKAELDTSAAKIQELVRALDGRKDEAIERTFKGAAKHFREVFQELVPGGRGELVMQKRHPGAAAAAADAGDDDGEDDARPVRDAHTGVLDKYSGVKVKVTFAAGGETMTLRQLSGGQKTLVALALIFAIQRCDPAPFYLFDEIDAALDPQYRTTVAAMLRKQANDARNPAQFIITTFHPQIVGEADQLFGVAHTNRISKVYAIRKEDALAFLQTAEEQQQAAGPQTGNDVQQGADTDQAAGAGPANARGGAAAMQGVAAGSAGGRTIATAAAAKQRKGKRSKAQVEEADDAGGEACGADDMDDDV